MSDKVYSTTDGVWSAAFATDGKLMVWRGDRFQGAYPQLSRDATEDQVQAFLQHLRDSR